MHGTKVISHTLAKSIKTINLVFTHKFIGLTDSNVGTANSTNTPVEYRSVGNIHTGNFRRNHRLPLDLTHGEKGAHRRFHLFTLFRHFLL